MSTAALPQASWPTIHRQFEAALPQIESTIRFHFRHWPQRHREEAITDARAATWHAWHGLLARGREPMALGPTGIAFNACRYVKAGRRLGTGSCGRSAMDVYERHARKGPTLKLVSLDREVVEGASAACDSWRAWLVTDNRSTPADEAAFRLDFEAWLAGLQPRKRRIAELLAEGHGTGDVARLLRVTPGAISQTRVWLKDSWHRFQGESTAAL